MQQDKKSKILKAARHLFMEHGFAGTSMGQIAKLADVNHSLLFYHFGNKERLWAAVKDDILKQLNKQASLLPSTELPFPKFLKKLFLNTVKYYKDNPDVHRIIYWQRVEKLNKANVKIELTKEMHAWHMALSQYQKKGEINDNVNIGYVIAMLISLTNMLALDPLPYVNDSLGQEDYINFCVTSLSAAFRGEALT